MQVVVILQSDPDSMSGTSHFKAVAIDEEAAMRWIQDEVDHKHGNGHQYMQGMPAEWWVKEYPVFKLQMVNVQLGVAERF